MGTEQGMIERARKDLGLGEPNYIQRWYRNRNGADYAGNWAWCQAAICLWAYESGNYDAVMFGKDDAYTVTAAQRFKSHGQWLPGTKANVSKAKPGMIAYFDWGRTNEIGAIDHVGVVEKILGNGVVQTIEGNTSDGCHRRTRSYLDIAGLGVPDYDGKSKAPVSTEKAAKFPGTYLEYPPLRDRSEACETWQRQMRHRGWSIAVDGYYGPESKRVCLAFQREKGLDDDGIVGPVTWKAAWEEPIT